MTSQNFRSARALILALVAVGALGACGRIIPHWGPAADSPAPFCSQASALEANDPLAAIAVYEDAVRENPSLTCARERVSRLYYEIGDYEQAVNAALALSQEQPESYQLQVTLGRYLTAAERYGEAETAYRRAFKLAPDRPELHYLLGLTLMKQKQYGSAAARFHSFIDQTADPLPYAEELAAAEKFIAWYEPRYASIEEVFNRSIAARAPVAGRVFPAATFNRSR